MKQHKGFTLLELLVVISIIGTLANIAVAVLGTAREKARDARRLADIRQIATALEFFYDDNGYYPRETADGSNGIVGEGAGIDTMLAPYIPNMPHDPSGPGDALRNYYYDGRQNCNLAGGDPDVAVIFARTMEDSTLANSSKFCQPGGWGGEGGAGSASAYHIILGPSDG